MTNIFVFSDNASTLNSIAILVTDTTVTVNTGTGALFPVPAAGQQFPVTVEDVSGNIEVMYCTGRTGDVLTVVRAQEGTTAKPFASGSRVELRCTSGVLGQMLQKTGGDTLSGTTTFNGVLAMASGSLQGGEFTGNLRGAPGQTGGQIAVVNGGTTATCNGSTILTQANFAANRPTNLDMIHQQMIVMWNGSTGAIPSGWCLCDNRGTQNGITVPDLRDRFVVGAGNTYAVNTTGGSLTTSSTSGLLGGASVASHTLTAAEMPAHSHDFYASTQCGYAGGPNPPFTIPMWSSNPGAGYQTNVPSNASSGAGSQIIHNTGGGGGHSHGLSGSIDHSHTYLPPYFALYYIIFVGP